MANTNDVIKANIVIDFFIKVSVVIKLFKYSNLSETLNWINKDSLFLPQKTK